MKKVLVSYQIPKEGLEVLEQKGFQVDFPENLFLKKEELIQRIPAYDVLISMVGKQVDRDIIEAGKNLKIISNFGVGYNNVDVIAATDCGILVTNTPQSVCEPTAELAFGLLLATMRNISGPNLGLRMDKKFKWGLMENLGNTLIGKQLGIVGMGNIGQAIARRAIAFGMSIVYHNRSKLPREITEKYNATYLPLKKLIQTSDAISLNMPFTEETYHMIGAEEFALMKNTAFLVNTARGQVVDEKALIKALQEKQIAGAGLDVFENEPKIPQELLAMPNVTMTPHTGSGTYEDRILTTKEVADNIIAFFDGNPQNVVNKN